MLRKCPLFLFYGNNGEFRETKETINFNTKRFGSFKHTFHTFRAANHNVLLQYRPQSKFVALLLL